MAREKVDNKLNVVIGTRAQIEADSGIPENAIIIVTDEELQADEVVYNVEKTTKEAIEDLEGNKIEEAPNDDKLYGRKNKAWEEIPVVPPMPSLPKPIYQARVNWITENGISYLFRNIHYINNPDGLTEFDHTDTIYRRVKEVTFCFMEFETIDPENPPTQPFSDFKRIQNITIPLLIDYIYDPMPEAPVMEQIDSLIHFPIIFKKLDGTDVTIKVTTPSGNMLLGADDTDFGNLQAEVTNLDVWEEGLPLGSPMQTIDVIIKYESRY